MSITVSYNISIPNDISALIEKDVQEKHLSRSRVICTILADYYNTRDYLQKNSSEILKAIDDVKIEISKLSSLNATSGSETGGSERFEPLPDNSGHSIKSSKK